MLVELELADILWAVKRLPNPVKRMLMDHPNEVFLAGGFIRACICGEHPSDIDLFVPSVDRAERFAHELLNTSRNPGARILVTDNATTVIGVGPFSIQFIHRWTFSTALEAIQSFDFTIAKAGIWYQSSRWCSACDRSFYADLAAKRLIYTKPIRNEDAGGSMLRVLKFYQRGYRIPLTSLGNVIARLVGAVDFGRIHGDKGEQERQLGKILSGLLFEVDPNAMRTDPAYIDDTEEDAQAARTYKVIRKNGTVTHNLED